MRFCGNKLRQIQSAVWLLVGLCLFPGIAQAAEPEKPAIDWEKEREFWSFKKPQKSELPDVDDRTWPKSRIDYFVLEKLAERKLSFSQPAGKEVMARRLFFDLNGLPPTPTEVAAFVGDERPDAYRILVDDLLGRRAFGERLASIWMNVARYAEDQAHQVGGNTTLNYPNAYRYREWVIGAFNSDMPYDQFISRQLAVDLLEPDNKRDLVALGFLGLGHKYYSRSRLEVQADEWAEKVDTVTRTFLGLTVACARCHDHKYDPITTEDYYGLAGIFASVKMVNKSTDGVYEKANTKADKMQTATLHLVEDDTTKTLNVFYRGDVNQKGPEVRHRYLSLFSGGKPTEFKNGSGRAELAGVIIARDNPLTARVMVNRIWALVFGKPLVGTPGNFGKLGQLPTHPALLDDLAVRFMENGWSIKWLVRELVTSATYRQSSLDGKEFAEIDPDNQFLWRMNRRRMTLEQFRDGVLAVSGQLDPKGGLSLELSDEKNLKRTVYSHVSRRELNKTMALFDYPDANVHAAQRFVSMTATQKLFVMNSPFIMSQAGALARNVAINGSDKSDAARIGHAFELLYSRKPTKIETDLGLSFLKGGGDSVSRWEQYAHALLAGNEMMYVD